MMSPEKGIIAWVKSWWPIILGGVAVWYSLHTNLTMIQTEVAVSNERLSTAIRQIDENRQKIDRMNETLLTHSHTNGVKHNN